MTNYSGMTVNERLFNAGLLDDFGAAARTGDRAKMVEILMQVALTKRQAEQSADAVLTNPSKYGLS